MEELKNDFRRRIGREIAELREEQGWSAEQVAEMAGVKPQTIEKIELGAFNVPMDVLEKVAGVIGGYVTIKTK